MRKISKIYSKLYSFFEFKYLLMHNIYYVLFIISVPSVSSGLHLDICKRKREIKKNFIQQLIKIQRRRCYRAPIKKLSLHWHLLQPLLTSLLVPVCESQPTASHSVFLWMKQVQLMSFKPKQENPLLEILDARHKELPLLEHVYQILSSGRLQLKHREICE